MSEHEAALKEACGTDSELYKALDTMGLFLNPQDQKEVDNYLTKVNGLEGQAGPTETARYAYRILIRLGLQLGRPELVKEYADREMRFASNKDHLRSLTSRSEAAVAAARKYYEKLFSKPAGPGKAPG